MKEGRSLEGHSAFKTHTFDYLRNEIDRVTLSPDDVSLGRTWYAGTNGRQELFSCAALGNLQMRELIMALKSGLPECVPWALNALALASFCARPDLPSLPSLPGLLPALLQVHPQLYHLSHTVNPGDSTDYWQNAH